MKVANQIIVLSLAGLLACTGEELGELSEGDRVAIRELNLAYPAAWLAGDSDQVMETFADDAVLVPALGNPPVRGVRAIREFFWPPDSPPGAVTRFEMEPDEIAGGGDLAYVWGTMSLAFATEGENGREVYTTDGNYLMIVRRDLDSGWSISRYIWNHPPWELVADEANAEPSS